MSDIIDREQLSRPAPGDNVSADNYDKDVELLRTGINYVNSKVLEGTLQDVSGQVDTYAELPDPNTLELGVRYLVVDDENTGGNYTTYVVRNSDDGLTKVWQVSLIGVPEATATNDGILTKEGFVKLSQAPTRSDIVLLQDADINIRGELLLVEGKVDANLNTLNVFATSKANETQPNNTIFQTTNLPARVIETQQKSVANTSEIININNKLEAIIAVRGLANASAIKTGDRALTINEVTRMTFGEFEGINDIIDDPSNPGNSVPVLEPYKDGIKAYSILNNNKDLSLQLIGGIWHNGAQDTTIRVELKYDKPGNPATTVIAGFQDIVITADEVNHSIGIKPTLSKSIFDGLAPNTPIDFYVEVTSDRTNTFVSSGLTFVMDERSDGSVAPVAETSTLSATDPTAEGGATQASINQATKLVGDKTAQIELSNGATLIDNVAVAKGIGDLQTDKADADLTNVDNTILKNKLNEVGFNRIPFDVNTQDYSIGIAQDKLFNILEAEWYDANNNPDGIIRTGSPVAIRFENPDTLNIERSISAEMVSRTDQGAYVEFKIALDVWVSANEETKKGTLTIRNDLATNATAVVTGKFVFEKTTPIKDITHLSLLRDIYDAYGVEFFEGDTVKMLSGKTGANENKYITATVGAKQADANQSFSFNGKYYAEDGESFVFLHLDIPSNVSNVQIIFDYWEEVEPTNTGITQEQLDAAIAAAKPKVFVETLASNGEIISEMIGKTILSISARCDNGSGLVQSLPFTKLSNTQNLWLLNPGITTGTGSAYQYIGDTGEIRYSGVSDGLDQVTFLYLD